VKKCLGIVSSRPNNRIEGAARGRRPCGGRRTVRVPAGGAFPPEPAFACGLVLAFGLTCALGFVGPQALAGDSAKREAANRETGTRHTGMRNAENRSRGKPAGSIETVPDTSSRRASRPTGLKGHGGPVKALALVWRERARRGATHGTRDATRDGMRARQAVLLSGSFDYSMIARTVGQDRILHRFDAFEGAVNAVALARLGGRDAYLAAGDDGKLWVFDVQSGRQLARLDQHTAKINHIAARDGLIVTSSWDRSAYIWRLRYDDRSQAAIATSQSVALSGHRGPVMAAAITSNGGHVFTASSDGNLRKYDASTGKLLRIAHKHGWGLNSLAMLPGGHLAFGAVDGSVGVFNIAADAVTTRLAKHDGPVLALATRSASNRTALLATGGGDGVIRVWDAANWSLLEAHTNPLGPVWALAFAPDARSVYFGGLDDTIHHWQISPRQPFEPPRGKYPRRFQITAKADTPFERGRVQFARKCSVCHTLGSDDGNRAGPTLYKIFGRKIASLPGYAYSEPLRDLDIIWTPKTVARLFELGPDVFTPGSKMPLQKMSDPRQRADLVTYLKQASVDSAAHR